MSTVRGQSVWWQEEGAPRVRAWAASVWGAALDPVEQATIWPAHASLSPHPSLPLQPASWHKDPNATSAWNGVVRGSKKWVMYPPHVTPPGASPRRVGQPRRHPLPSC